MAAAFFHETLLTSREADVKTARDYLKGRGVNLETVKKFQLGFAPNEWDALLKYLKSKGISEELMQKAGLIIAREGKSGFYDRFRNRIMFPILDIQNRFLAFGARAMKEIRWCEVYQLSGDRGLHQRPAYVWPAVDQDSGWEIGSRSSWWKATWI